MASVVCDPNGRKRVTFTNRDGDRKAIRLGKMSTNAAAGIAAKVEHLNTSIIAGVPLEPELAKWVANMHEKLHSRLVRVGLALPRSASAVVSLDTMLTAFFAAADVKPATRIRMEQARRALVDHFGDGRNVATITERDADEWRAQLRTYGYAAATISRTVLYARQMFRWGVRRKLVATNPFADIKAGSQVNSARQAFVDRETIAKVIEAAPDGEWRLLIVLSRFGGLRVPSEALALRWSDVDWANGRITVRSPKTEHHEGRGERVIPMFPEIRAQLLPAFERAADGAVYVISRYREGFNPHTQMLRIIRRAGIPVWPRVWHNLRASRQTELASSFPLHTVCAWIGNTKAIAAGHYLQITDADWTRAVSLEVVGAKSGAPRAQKEAQQHFAASRAETASEGETLAFSGVSRENATPSENEALNQVGRPGLEPGTLRV